MTQIPDSAKQRIEEAADKARGGRACDIFTVAAEFGYRLAKSELVPLLREANEWIKKNHEMPGYSDLIARIEVVLSASNKSS